MFRIVFSGKQTCKPVKKAAPGSKREQFSSYTMKTLGSGDLLGETLAVCRKIRPHSFRSNVSRFSRRFWR